MAVQVNLRTLSLHFNVVRSMGLLLKHKTYCPIFSDLDLEEPVKRLIELATSTTGIQVSEVLMNWKVGGGEREEGSE